MDKLKYIQNLEPEMLVAFKVVIDGVEYIKSGRIFKIYEDFVQLKEFSGQMMMVLKKDIIWVKTGQRWPKEIFQALTKGEQDE